MRTNDVPQIGAAVICKHLLRACKQVGRHLKDGRRRTKEGRCKAKDLYRLSQKQIRCLEPSFSSLT